jgi:carboxyl-terminal processing protease
MPDACAGFVPGFRGDDSMLQDRCSSCQPIAVIIMLLVAAAPGIVPASLAEGIRDLDRERAHTMLKTVRKSLEKHYYDARFRGMDLEDRFAKADRAIDQATSLSHAFGIIAQAVLDLNDSHTFFVPPERTVKVEYGWQMRMIGDTAHVIAVKPGSDAEAKGLRIGDAVLSVDGIAPTRQNLWKLVYRYYTIRPEPGMRLEVQSPGGQPRQIDVLAKVRQEKRVLDLTQGEDIWDLIRKAENAEEEHRYIETKDRSLLIWNMPSFSVSEEALEDLAGKLHKFQAVILDLRGNAGGYEDTLVWLLGYFFEHEVSIGQPKGRKEMDPLVAKPRGKKAFGGKLVVLVDSASASAAELFARVLQLEKRATVLGDRTAGAVMRSRYHHAQMGAGRVIPYGVNVTESDVIMADGQSLEHVGVAPDELLLPTGADLAAGRDPVLSRAAALIGVDLPAEQAGTMFPIEWD